jgi:hypothetical protein
MVGFATGLNGGEAFVFEEKYVSGGWGGGEGEGRVRVRVGLH